MSISITSLSVVSLMAMVPESEWRMPTLIVSSALAAAPQKTKGKTRRGGKPAARRSPGDRAYGIEHRDVLVFDARDRPGTVPQYPKSQGACQASERA